ncbi:YegS/Rv2252/BmrU family lipid kinase [Oenococcus sp. UCMA 16435]|nr:YegS/Rv2252/BmrU family lipid kinase [Oenococcus sp. UCMA 16435]
MRPHFYAIINQHAGNHRGREIWHRIQDYIIDVDIRLSVLISSYPGAPRDFAYDLATNIPDKKSNIVILAFGGDGTLHEVLNGLINAKRKYPLPLAYLAAGSGNDFARGAKLESARHWKENLQELLKVDHSNNLNIGVYKLNKDPNKHYFMNSFGIGFDGTVVNASNKSKYKKGFNYVGLGAISYLISAIATVFKAKSYSAELKENNLQKKFPRAFLMAVTNHPYFGGGIKIAPDEKIEKHDLKLVVFQKNNLIQLIGNLLTIVFGSFQYKMKSVYSNTLKDDFSLNVDSKQLAQIDGQVLNEDYFRLNFSRTTYPFWLPDKNLKND